MVTIKDTVEAVVDEIANELTPLFALEKHYFDLPTFSFDVIPQIHEQCPAPPGLQCDKFLKNKRCLYADVFLANMVANRLYKAGVVTLTIPPKNLSTQQASANTLPTIQAGIWATYPPARVPVRNVVAPSEPDTLTPWEFMELMRKRKAQNTAGGETDPLSTESESDNEACEDTALHEPSTSPSSC